MADDGWFIPSNLVDTAGSLTEDEDEGRKSEMDPDI
jgi:hypothetical protein